tara:strand:+ start:367 stop:510 length:144 start_codon:yes stop_codon:yes gene_type:complete
MMAHGDYNLTARTTIIKNKGESHDFTETAVAGADAGGLGGMPARATG